MNLFPFKSKRVRELEAELNEAKRRCDSLLVDNNTIACEWHNLRNELTAAKEDRKTLLMKVQDAEATCSAQEREIYGLREALFQTAKERNSARDDAQRLQALGEGRASDTEDLRRMRDRWKEDADAKALTIQEVRRGLTAMLGYISGGNVAVPLSPPAEEMPMPPPPEVVDVREGVRQLIEDMAENMETETDMDASCRCAHGCAPCSGCVDGHVSRKRLVHRARNFLADAAK